MEKKERYRFALTQTLQEVYAEEHDYEAAFRGNNPVIQAFGQELINGNVDEAERIVVTDLFFSGEDIGSELKEEVDNPEAAIK